MGDEAEEQVEVEGETEERQLWIREVGAPRSSRCAIKKYLILWSRTMANMFLRRCSIRPSYCISGFRFPVKILAWIVVLSDAGHPSLLL